MFHELKYMFQPLKQNFHSAKITIIALSYNNFSVIFQKSSNIDVFGHAFIAFSEDTLCSTEEQRTLPEHTFPGWNENEEYPIKNVWKTHIAAVFHTYHRV